MTDQVPGKEEELKQPEVYEDPDYVWGDENGDDVDWIHRAGKNAGHKTDAELFGEKKDEEADGATAETNGEPADDQPEA